jgi:predicted CopG family antitoxin
MIKELEIFKSYFKYFNDSFVIVGGTACSLLYENTGDKFRSTKDIDIVITITELKKSVAFSKQFYKFIKDGSYSTFQKDDKIFFYRFINPQQEDFPKLIELFSNKQLKKDRSIEINYTSLDKDDNYHLSAIIIENDCYNLISKNVVNINELPVAKPLVLIFLKAIAWDDLKTRKNSGEKNVDTKDIKKHRSDIIRINEILTGEDELYINKELYNRLIMILKRVEESFSDVDIKNIIKRKNFNKSEIFRNIISKYKIDK